MNHQAMIDEIKAYVTSDPVRCYAIWCTVDWWVTGQMKVLEEEIAGGLTPDAAEAMIRDYCMASWDHAKKVLDEVLKETKNLDKMRLEP